MSFFMWHVLIMMILHNIVLPANSRNNELCYSTHIYQRTIHNHVFYIAGIFSQMGTHGHISRISLWCILSRQPWPRHFPSLHTFSVLIWWACGWKILDPSAAATHATKVDQKQDAPQALTRTWRIPVTIFWMRVICGMRTQKYAYISAACIPHTVTYCNKHDIFCIVFRGRETWQCKLLGTIEEHKNAWWKCQEARKP